MGHLKEHINVSASWFKVDEETGADIVKTISVDVPFLIPSDEYPQAIKS
jgi:hypothetical protein